MNRLRPGSSLLTIALIMLLWLGVSVESSTAHEPVMPPVVYVPCAVDENDERHAVLRYTNDGRIPLLVYTALDRLHRRAGDVPWALMGWAGLERIQEEKSFDMIIQDIYIPEVDERGGDQILCERVRCRCKPAAGRPR